jgi:anti-sigma regulatory factor (Ser/Thr protein kinase)
MQWSIDRLDASSIRSSRRSFVEYLQRGARPGSDIDAAQAIFGELAANAVEHGNGAISAGLYASTEGLILVIADEGIGVVAQQPIDIEAESLRGRGLFIVHSLARDVRFAKGGGSRIEVVLPVELLERQA